ncbi:MAG: GNAT family N-acetyltransferase [Negativicutes bacterium]
MEIVVRQETDEDYEIVYEAVKTAFFTAEHTNFDEQNLVVRLRKSAAFIPELSLVAVMDDKIVGHIMFTKMKIKNETKEFESLVLAPVSVVPEMQDKGIGTKMIIEGHKIAQGLGYGSVILVGHPAYYPRFGYVPASRFGITASFDVPDEAFMVCELTANGLYGVAGVVHFPEEFLL